MTMVDDDEDDDDDDHRVDDNGMTMVMMMTMTSFFYVNQFSYQCDQESDQELWVSVPDSRASSGFLYQNPWRGRTSPGNWITRGARYVAQLPSASMFSALLIHIWLPGAFSYQRVRPVAV